MSEASPTGDPHISQSEEAEVDADRARRAADLFDLRRIIGGLFAIYGVILLVLGLGASDADIEKAAGWNLNLWVGVAMLITAALFLAWAFARPLGQEMVDEGYSAYSSRAGAPGVTATEPLGGSTPGGSRASTEPPKPPPTMRAPAAPACMSATTVASTSATLAS